MIEVTNLVKRYGDRNVVDNLSFTVEKGQIVGFLGPNGAGKSTTMNIITGYISATSGTVKVNGYDIYDDPEKAKACIGYLPEQPPVYPDMKVREYLSFVADLKKVKKSEKEKKIRYVMKSTKIMDVSERLIKHLSKGYKQRVGLAGAMLGDPEILILDEPTVGLDPKQIIEIRNLITELSKNHTILLSSHIMQEVSAVCNQILIINQGKMILCDKPENISSHIAQTNDLSLVIKGNKDLVKSIFESFDDVSDLKILGTDEKDVYHVELSTPIEVDIREELFYKLAESKCPILELNHKVPTLEEVFLRLTGEGTKQYGGKLSKEEKKKMRQKLAKAEEEAQQLVEEPQKAAEEKEEE
ncbi:MAG: ATP-binding cassette domain-containing protein [Clostridiales bacterium]|nr:ABC transporter ATP-binding protein [Eubacterium sp.]MDD7350476.1 ATP-binding cassette domain-containing protein [Clostridiales bacterium]